MAIRATDDEQLARSLWGDEFSWDEARAQFVPGEATEKAGSSESTVDESDPYAGRDYRDLKTMAKDRGLVTTGTKDEVVARLIAADAEKAALQETGD